MTLADVIGLGGVALYLVAYAGLQLGRLSPGDGRATLLNLSGGILVIFSLLHSFNIAAMVMQVVWFLLTIVGYMRQRRANE